ncbi:transglycosylase domain-containing protein [Actinoplanes sp. NPDC048791]|uniref:transglycosylase domain-containing protein n=1 Tax=Actinoplanes sp. NPDC048791 TaxID=3154623 RepID=UPI00340DF091
MRGRDHHFVTNVSSLLVCGLLAGVAVAAAAFPAVAMSGLAAKAGGEAFENLPSQLKQATAPQLTRVFAADNKTLITVFYDEFRSEVGLKNISINMQNAIVAAEDHQFFKHNGVDLKGSVRALVNNKQGGDKQGASTLTMQLVKMSLAYSASTPQEVVDATEDTTTRKVTEMKYAMQLEKELTKQQILERYLNAAPFGNGSYGIFAASQVYFKKQPKDLTVAESALLASMVKAPSGFDPTTPRGYPRALDRRNWVIGNMRDLGYITPEAAAAAIKVKLGRTTQRTGNGCASVQTNHWGFFCDYFYRWWLSRPEFGRTVYDRERRLKSGGYRIQSSLDIKAQAATRKNITDKIGINNRDALLLAAVQPGTGRVRALAANRRFKLDVEHNKMSSDPKKAAKNIRGTYPNTTNPLLTGGGDITGYQAGSVFKMFTMVAALENGYPPSYPINTTYQYKSGYRDTGPASCGGGYWCPTNASKSEKGSYNMWTGFGASVNTFFVPLEESVGADKVVDVAQRFGVQFRSPKEKEMATKNAKDWGAFTLGVSASTPLEMANAYATLAADGKYCSPTPVQQISTAKGEKLDVGKPNCRQATKPDVARMAIDAARCPVGDFAQLGSCKGRTAGAARGAVGHPIFGKTGTTDNDKTASLIIGTTSMVVAGYLVNPDYQDHPYRLSHSIVNPAVWETMHDIMKGKPREQFKKPSGDKLPEGEQRSIPDVKCLSVAAATSKVKGAGFIVGPGTEIASDCPAGEAAGTAPEGRTIEGGFVSIQISKGKEDAGKKDPKKDDKKPGNG